ncbi:cupin domain-containing protein [Rhodococcus sp. 14C212]|uniref:cupin domain-containing protein n=1 Tax=Rhodococcus sp. 14C212 TaxID=2711209 RepID=UPI0013EC4C41|nr:cupin domain-containing protein [Rhodococcus sp. 14C212]NGP09255.1 cupin domain-containing protein [Rhodococcus sp. 14C212]
MSKHHEAQARRVVTGVNEAGKSCFVSDELTPDRFVAAGNTKCDIWRVASIPVSPEDGPGLEDGVITQPPASGLVYRVVSFAPDSEWDQSAGYADSQGQLAGSGDVEASGEGPAFHVTDTVDIVTILSGEIVAIMETEETVLRAGDTLIQRGTNHAWSNRTDEPVVLQSIMISAVGR